MEASGAFLEEELLVCIIKVDNTFYGRESIENTYYCVPITEDGLWEDLTSQMDLVKCVMGQEDPLMVDPYKEFRDKSNKKKMDDAGLND
jgi:hypothetical protein